MAAASASPGRRTPRRLSTSRASSASKAEDMDSVPALQSDEAESLQRARALLDDERAKPLAVYALRDQMLRLSETTEENDDRELQLDWDLYRDVPASMEQEEALLLDYFRKLKFIYLEQETKLRFLADLQDDPETGQEPQILTTADVARREQECKRVKQQLVDAKARVRELRDDIDATADALDAPVRDVERAAAEAQTLLTEITDMELELAKTKAAEATHGSMTTAEAEALLDEQIAMMQTLDDETTTTAHEMDHAKKELAEALRQLDRLKAERAAAEKRANDAKLGMGRHKARDWHLERLCAKHAAVIETLQAALGIVHLAAPAPDTLEIHVARTAPLGAKKRHHDAVDEPKRVIQLAWDEPGGRLRDVQVDGAPVDQCAALSADEQRDVLAAVQRNDAPYVMQALWRAPLP